jgi:hypothetical protein
LSRSRRQILSVIAPPPLTVTWAFKQVTGTSRGRAPKQDSTCLFVCAPNDGSQWITGRYTGRLLSEHAGRVARARPTRPTPPGSTRLRRPSAPSYDRALWALRAWLDSWPGIGQFAVGMARQGFDLQLTRYDERGWCATFYTTGMEHSPTSATGTGCGAHAVARDTAGGVRGMRQPHEIPRSCPMRLTDNKEVVGARRLVLICAERTRQTRRFQSSSAPRVLLSPRTEQRELSQARGYVELCRKTEGRR